MWVWDVGLFGIRHPWRVKVLLSFSSKNNFSYLINFNLIMKINYYRDNLRLGVSRIIRETPWLKHNRRHPTNFLREN